MGVTKKKTGDRIQEEWKQRRATGSHTHTVTKETSQKKIAGFMAVSVTQKHWVLGYFYYTSIFAFQFNSLLIVKVFVYNVTFFLYKV